MLHVLPVLFLLVFSFASSNAWRRVTSTWRFKTVRSVNWTRF